MTDFEMAISDNVNYFYYKISCNKLLLVLLMVATAVLALSVVPGYEDIINTGLILCLIVYIKFSERPMYFSPDFAKRKWGEAKEAKLRQHDEKWLSAKDIRDILAD